MIDYIPKIGKEFVDCLKQVTNKNNADILLYGSTVYGITSSDLDVTFIVRKFIAEEYERIRELTVDFQKQHGMELDNEVPYASKLVYTDDQVEQMLRKSPFEKINGIYRIRPIEKTPEFLSSKEMKYRLLLNILTTRSLVLRGDSKKIDSYRQQAWELLVQVIISYNELSEVTIDRFIELLYKDEKSGKEGEMFLGYKTNILQKRRDLEDDTEKAFYRLVEKNILKREKGTYKIDEDLIQ